MDARLDAPGSKWRPAHRNLDRAEAAFTRGHMIHWLARFYLTRAECRLGEGYFDRALARGDATTARNDGESAFQIAEPCEYAWAERDACEALAQAWRNLLSHPRRRRFSRFRDAPQR